MVTWVGCVRLELTFSHGNLYGSLESLILLYFFYLYMKCRNLQICKICDTDTEFSQFLSRLWTHLWCTHSLIKNNSTVTRLGYLYEVNPKFSPMIAFAFFLHDLFKTHCVFINRMSVNICRLSQVERGHRRYQLKYDAWNVLSVWICQMNKVHLMSCRK